MGKDIFGQVGCFTCNVTNCGACSFYSNGKKKSIQGQNWKLLYDQTISCFIEFVIYGIIYPGGKLYAGQTIRQLRVRFGEHKCIINKVNHPLLKHVKGGTPVSTRQPKSF